MDNNNATVSQNDATNDTNNITDTTSDINVQQVARDVNEPNQEEPSEELSPDDLTDDETIDLFIYGIMKEKGTDVGSEEMQSEIFKDLKNKLLSEIDRSLIAELPDDKLEEFNKIAVEKGEIDPNLVADAIKQAGLDVTEITGVTMARFRDLYLGKTQDSADTQLVEEAE